MLIVSCDNPSSRLGTNPEEAVTFQPIDVSNLPRPLDPVLAKGQDIYIQYCGRCHQIGKAGAPRTGKKSDWSTRRRKGLDLLIKHAIEGYESPSGNEMPPRGGEKTLSDTEVAAAVKLMLHLSTGNTDQ